jgi:hypothetical protein
VVLEDLAVRLTGLPTTDYVYGVVGMIDTYDSVFQFQQLRTVVEEVWDNIPRATISSLINSM